MSEMVKTGSKIELDISLENDNPVVDKFVRVTLKSANGDTLPESPVALTDQGGGRHFDNSVTKNPGSVSALFEVFDDAGFAVQDLNFENASERYIDPPFSSAFVDCQRVSAKISENRVSAEIVQNVVAGEVEPSAVVSGKVTSDEISGTIEQNNVNASIKC